MKKTKKVRDFIDFHVFVLPAVVMIVVSTLIPFATNIYYSLMKWDGVNKTKFIGLKNFTDMFTRDTRLSDSLLFSAKYMVVIVVLINVLGLMLALLLNTKIRSRNILRTIYFLPYGLSGLIAALMFNFIFTMGFSQLYDASGIELFNWGWLSDPKLAWISVVIVDIWKGLGYYMIIYVAGLQGIPGELIESARVDGANSVQSFFKITLPLMMPTITVCLFFAMSGALNVFDIPYALTGGGPGYSTTGMPQNIYREAFSNQRFGYASAKSLFYFLIVMVVSFIQLKVTQSREVEV